MALAAYLAFLGVSCVVALTNWRRGWLLLLVCGVIQDPVRKLTPGTPVVVSFSIVALYAVILFAARRELFASVRELSARFGTLYTAVIATLFLLCIAAMNGLFTFGLTAWRVPLLSLFTYLAPLPAILLGYTYLQREEMLDQIVRVYSIATSIALVGTMLEYFRVNSRVLGLVAFQGEYIRHLPGLQIRMLSGFYRSPDIMGWHAATLTVLASAMALRAGVGKRLLLWSGVAAWGFLNCMVSGRRKAIYYVAVFGIVFLWRYFKRLRPAQIVALFAMLAVLAGVVVRIASNQQTSAYAQGAMATRGEIAQRLEGGALFTLQQFGVMGAGLGTATQGTQHLRGGESSSWQEGGLAKLAIEVGLPGLLAMFVTAWILLRLLLRLTAIQDVEGSSQFVRVMLFAFFMANLAGFMASAQAYTDALLSLTTAFLFGCLLATAALDERLAMPAQAATQKLTAPSPA